MFKKVYNIFFLFFLLLVLSACKNNNNLIIYNWGEYLAPEVKDEFTKKTGIKITEVKFDSSQIAETSIKSGNHYDIVLMTEFSVHNMKDKILNGEKILKPINWNKINIKKEDLINDVVSTFCAKLESKKGYNLLDYMIPYAFGNFGILYNEDKISFDLVKEKEWEIINETKYKDGKNNLNCRIYESPVEIVSVALKALGIDVADASKEDIIKAKNWLSKIPKQNKKFITDAIFDDVPNGSCDLVFAISGEAKEIISRSLDDPKFKLNLNYYVPKKLGSNIWLDGITLTNKCNEEFAYKFINFYLNDKIKVVDEEIEVSLFNADELGFPSPYKNTYQKQISNAEEFLESIKNNTNEDYQRWPEEAKKRAKKASEVICDIIKIEINDHDEIWLYDDEIRKFIDEIWINFMAESSSFF